MLHPRLHLLRHGVRVLGLGIIPRIIPKTEPLTVILRLRRRDLRSALLSPPVEEFALLLRRQRLLLIRLREKGLRLREGRVNGGYGDAVVLDVEEARVLGRVADGGGEGFALGLGAADGEEVDDGDLGGVAVPGRGLEDVAVDGAVGGHELELVALWGGLSHCGSHDCGL